jgi:hydroxymethylglutaryl-CoA synthase
MANDDIGIVGYGCYVPRCRIKVEEIAKVWGEDAASIKSGLAVEEKSVPDIDEDTITISVAAAKNAVLRAGIPPVKIGALYIGSESHPYVVKPSGTVVSDALGMGPEIMVADMEFACKAGTAGVQCCYSHVKSGLAEYAMAIGADTAQGRPGDALEYTAAAGGVALIMGRDPLAVLEGTYSFTTDTSDFWRREGQDYPSHGARFTGKPAYFKHVTSAAKALLTKLNAKPSDFQYAVFHMPNGKFAITAATSLGFTMQQLEPSLVVRKMGNCYSGSSMMGLCSVLDVAKPGDRIFMVSYGSGAGSDAFVWRVTDRILERREKAKKTYDYIDNKRYIDYATYVRMRGKLKSD